MKKIFIIVSIVLIFVSSCTKIEKEDIKSPQNIGIEKTSIFRDSINVSFDEMVIVDTNFSTALGVESFEIETGTYYLVFNAENPFGIVTFNTLNNFNPQIYNTNGIAIKIARRTCNCACGIGFRCGVSSYNPPQTNPISERYLQAKVTFNSGKIIIRMAEEIPESWF